MAQKEYFSHTSPEGKTPWYWFRKNGYSYIYAGENLAIHFFDSKDLVQAWLDSPSHRANILNKNFSNIGVGISKGLYEGKETIFIVQLFGKQKSVLTLKASTVPAPIPKSQPTGTPISQNTKGTSFTNEDTAEQDAEPIESTEASPLTPESVHGIETPEQESSLAAKIASSPRNSFEDIYFAAMIFTAAALILNIFIRIKIQYTSLIFNGFIILTLIIFILWVNQYLAFSQARIFYRFFSSPISLNSRLTFSFSFLITAFIKISAPKGVVWIPSDARANLFFPAASGR